MEKINHIQLLLKENIFDVVGARVAEDVKKYLKIDTGKVKTGKIFSILYKLNKQQLNEFANLALKDSIIHDVYINNLFIDTRFKTYILISKLPGVTDDEGNSAQKTFCDLFNVPFNTQTQWIFSREIYYIENYLEMSQLTKIAEGLLGNSLINHFECGVFNGKINYIPTVTVASDEAIDTIDIFVPDDQLTELSKTRLLSLDLNELKVIKNYFNKSEIQKQRREIGLTDLPTDCELEIFAQTWSEHCKHKEFDAVINYKDLDNGKEKTIDSLFKTYIKKATEIIQKRLEENGSDWLLKVFSDNAGVVKIDEDRVFIWKVETHNSPSALDPYGGALTGIVGVNRDPLGTGVGGAKLFFNTNVLCFGFLNYKKKLLKGQLHPRRIYSGVVKGIEDGGNKSGIPTVNGALIFDNRYSGKPLVYCGTGAIMPAYYNGRKSWEKRIDDGDRIVMAGGRVGKDGIHGATFSSAEIDEHSPRSAVQIGSPITQKNLSDFLEKACRQGLVKCSTDNGAGGLSSSVGELAQLSGGAVVNIEKVPLKYSGLKPWEIFLSESQERMTLVIESDKLKHLFKLANEYEVELSDIGYFNKTGVLDVRYDNNCVAYLDLSFLHDGIPKKVLNAEWTKPELKEPDLPQKINYNELLLRLMSSPNICSRESIIRRYDHEVKGKTIIKPLMGGNGHAPQDAAVLRVDFDSFVGFAISNGIIPRYGDIDAYHMSAGAFDEAVRQIVAVGGKLPDPQKRENQFWSVNDNFCVPDSVYDEKTNPDGKYKLAQLVRMCEALFDMSTFFNIPMTSGKDSMKNDFISEGVKISVPPTVLYSMVAKIADIRNTITTDFKKEGDLIYLVGNTYNELGGSEFYKLFDELGANVPVVRKEQAKRIYEKIMMANEHHVIESCHDISDGGMIVALIEGAFSREFGIKITLFKEELELNAILFSESHSRFVVTIAPENETRFLSIMGNDCKLLGNVTMTKNLTINYENRDIVNIEINKLLNAWISGLKI